MNIKKLITLRYISVPMEIGAGGQRAEAFGLCYHTLYCYVQKHNFEGGGEGNDKQ